MATELQEKKIERIAERAVIRVFQRMLADPDFGLELRPEFERKLKRSATSKKEGRLRDFKDVIAALS